MVQLQQKLCQAANSKDVREVPRKNWGYLPEERGLYPKMRVDEQLLFLARLNGVSKQAAEKELDEWLGRFQINANRKKKVEELSRGTSRRCSFSPLFCTTRRSWSWMSRLAAWTRSTRMC